MCQFCFFVFVFVVVVAACVSVCMRRYSSLVFLKEGLLRIYILSLAAEGQPSQEVGWKV